jgi:hypothetical protein
MNSQRRIEANRRNAQRSTGPRTLSGKERSRLNARTHGLVGVEPKDQRVRDLAMAICADASFVVTRDKAIDIARTTLMLRRVRDARVHILERTCDLLELCDLDRYESLDRYERRALSRRKRAIRDVIASNWLERLTASCLA